jgi:DNA replication protein DnaC
MGTAGTGKSYLINMICNRLCEIARSHDVNAESPIVVLVPTGVAAFNIHGTMIHSTLSIPVSSKTFDLNGESLKKLHNRLKGVSYLLLTKKHGWTPHAYLN